MAGGNSPAQLGADNVIRFVDAAHFLRELAGNLGRGRAFVRTRRTFELRRPIAVRIEAPGIDQRVSASAIVVFNRDGFLGLEFESFEEDLLPALDALGQAAEARVANGPAERTVVASISDLMSENGPSETIRGAVIEEDLPPALAPTPVDGNPEVRRADVDATERDRGPNRRTADPTVPPPSISQSVRPRRRPILAESDPDAGLAPTDGPPIPRRRRPAVEDLQGFEITAQSPSSAEPAFGAESLPSPADFEDRGADVTAEMGEEESDALVIAVDPALAPTFEGSAPEDLREMIVSGHEAPTAMSTADSPLDAPADLDIFDAPLAESDPENGSPPWTERPTVEPDDVLDDKRWHLPRTTTGGVLRMTDPSDLLGLYLLEVRHGTLTLFGGPTGETGDQVRIKIIAGRVVELTATIVARMGEWLTVHVEDHAPLQALLTEHRGPLADTLRALGVLGDSLGEVGDAPLDGLPEALPEAPPDTPPDAPPDAVPHAPPVRVAPAAASAAAIVPPPSSELLGTDDSTADPKPPAGDDSVGMQAPTRNEGRTGAPAAGEPGPEETPSGRRRPVVQEPSPQDPSDLYSGQATTGDLVAAIVAGARQAAAPKVDIPSASPEPELASAAPSEAAPDGPQPARLEDDLVVFAHRDDLVLELSSNLKNGGLFVISKPIPIRTKMRLRVRVGVDMLPFTLESDVVFANDGRVGLSIANATAAQENLQKYLDGKLPPSPVPADRETPDLAIAKTGTLNTTDVEALNEGAAKSADLMAFSGTLTAPPIDAELLVLQERRIEDPSQLGSVSVLLLFEYIYRQHWKGVLTIKSATEKRKIWMHEGSVAFIESEPYDESSSLGRLLVGQKKVSEAQLREALEKSKQTGRSLGRSLVLLGALKRSDITAALREQVRHKMDAAFGWPSGRYDWTPWTEPPGEADLVLTRSIGVLARHLRARFDYLNISEIEKLFGADIGRRVAHAQNVDTLASSLHLSPRDLRFLELQVDGTKTVVDAAMGSPLGRLASLRLVALGLALGFVQFTNQAAPRARASTHGGTSAEMQKLKKQFKERLALMNGQNHFERLGVHWSAHHRSFRAAYDEVSRGLDTNRSPLRDAPHEVKDVARQIRSELDNAFKVLTDPQRRAQYRKQLFDATEREYAADMLVKQGEVALMRGDRVQAIECLETAVELAATPRNRSLLMSAREGRS